MNFCTTPSWGLRTCARGSVSPLGESHNLNIPSLGAIQTITNGLDPKNVEPNSDRVKLCQATISYNRLEDRTILRLGAYIGAPVVREGAHVEAFH